MKKIEEYIQLTLEERQRHLKLDEECIERGGGYSSIYCRGILAITLNTTIPEGKRTFGGIKVHACHACSNSKCSNPNHLYWGTPKENASDDLKVRGSGRSGWVRAVAKYGLEEARSRWSKSMLLSKKA